MKSNIFKLICVMLFLMGNHVYSMAQENGPLRTNAISDTLEQVSPYNTLRRVYIGYAPWSFSGKTESMNNAYSVRVENGIIIKNKYIVEFHGGYNYASKSTSPQYGTINGKYTQIVPSYHYKYHTINVDLDLGYPLLRGNKYYVVGTAGLGVNMNWGDYSYQTAAPAIAETSTGSIDGLNSVDFACNVGVALCWTKLSIKCQLAQGLSNYAKDTQRRILFIGVGYAF